MIESLVKINQVISDDELSFANIIPWSTPIYSFGKIENSKIATLGINPSNREFEDLEGNELEGNLRRFHTLNSLKVESWKKLDLEKTFEIKKLCDEYFLRNPYDQWFKKLDYLFSGSSYSYYFPSVEACHLDLIPYATEKKWSELNNNQKKFLLEKSFNFLGEIVKHSKINYFILNGSTVIKNFEKITNIDFIVKMQPKWTLNRKNNKHVVKGYSFEGEINKIGNIKLNRIIKVYGFNHNIQSSYGITNDVQKSIRNWLSNNIK